MMMPSLRPGGTRAVSHVPLPNTSPAPRTVSHVPLPSYAQPSPTQAQASATRQPATPDATTIASRQELEQRNGQAGGNPTKPQAPAQARPGAGSKLMSLNSKIMAAQREWEQKNQLRSASSGSSSRSESFASTESDESSLGLTGGASFIVSSAGPITGEKRSLGSLTLEASSRPAKRILSTSFGTSSSAKFSSETFSPAVFSPMLQADQSMAPAHARQHVENDTNHPVVDESEWLRFKAFDSITTRANGVLYDYYYASKDRMESMSGALMPTNYRLDLASSLPYVCPDRACNKSFDSARALGGHFSSGHKGSAYNDNCDGTFTKVGFYDKVHGEKWRAIVVSRVSVTGSEEEDVYTEKTTVPFTTAHVSLTHPDPFTYVTSFLPSHIDYTRFLLIPYIRELCQLPKRRQLPPSWINFHRGKDLSHRMFALAVAYITGTEVFGVDACDGGLHEVGDRLSYMSIAVPFELSEVHRTTHFSEESCVGCHYSAEFHGRSNRCSWSIRRPSLHRYERRVDGLEDSDDDDGASAYTGAANEVALRRRSARAVDCVIKAGKAARLTMPSLNPPLHAAQSPLVQESVETPELTYNDRSQELEQPPTGFVYDLSRTYADAAKIGGGTREAEAAEVVVMDQPPASSRVGRSTRASRKVVQSSSPESRTRPGHPDQAPPPQFEMESWEVAPGRITESTRGENIGYSNAYLNGREPVEVSEDVAFNVLTIKPGDKARWHAQESQLRTCSVASGKIEIKIGANKFGAGPNSLVIIQPGETCVVTNKLYIDATVHCTTVKKYTLLS